MERRLLDALVLTFRNFATFSKVVKSKATVDATGYVYYIHLPILHLTSGACMVVIAYIHIGVGSALLVFTTWAMRRPRKVRRVTGTGSHAFLFHIGITAESGGLIGNS